MKRTTIERNSMPLDKQADLEYLLSKQAQSEADMEFLAMCTGVILEQESAGISGIGEDYAEEEE